MLVDAFFLQLLDDLDLGSDTCMVGAGLPQCIVALHSLITDQDILHGVVQCMPHVELSCDIWGRDHDSEGSLTVIYLRMEILFVKPLLIQSVFYAAGVIGLG